MKKVISGILIIAWFSTQASSQNLTQSLKGSIADEAPVYKFSLSTAWLTFDQFSSTSVYMYEFHFGYRITPKDIIAIKACTWKTYAPMGIPIWNSHFQKESEYYPGKIREYGIGISYQRFLWKGLFASVQILPLLKIYLNEKNKKADDGFRLYTSYHLGYHIPLFDNRFYLEPQTHCNYWPINSKGPRGFEEKDSKWNKYFLFEPNLFIGINF